MQLLSTSASPALRPPSPARRVRVHPTSIIVGIGASVAVANAVLEVAMPPAGAVGCAIIATFLVIRTVIWDLREYDERLLEGKEP